MFFEEKDILMLKNIKFKNGLLDTSIYGHPVLVIKVEDGYFYYLTITSSDKTAYSNEFYKIYKDKTNNIPVGYLTDEVYNEVMNELYYYQENIKTDKEYTRVKKYI